MGHRRVHEGTVSRFNGLLIYAIPHLTVHCVCTSLKRNEGGGGGGGGGGEGGEKKRIKEEEEEKKSLQMKHFPTPDHAQADKSHISLAASARVCM